MTTASDSELSYHEIPLERLSRAEVVCESVDGLEILAVSTPDGIRVYSGVCPHLGGPLLEGSVQDHTIRCPWHGYRFDLASGRCLTAPGGPWRSLVGGSPETDEPMQIELTQLRFEEIGESIRVYLAGARGSRKGAS